MAHPTVVPRQLRDNDAEQDERDTDDGDADEEQPEDSDVRPNWGRLA